MTAVLEPFEYAIFANVGVVTADLRSFCMYICLKRRENDIQTRIKPYCSPYVTFLSCG
jgi:hypothetical protein